jgi:uncharacterized protein YvpB
MVDTTLPCKELLVPDSYVFLDARPAYAIVIHKSASPGMDTPTKLANYFQSGSDGREVSSHYIVGLDGSIVQCVREKDGAGANSAQPVEAGRNTLFNAAINWNLRTISIEIIDTSINNTETIPAVQRDSVYRLVADIAKRRGISYNHIVGHRDIQPISKPLCPGNFPLTELIQYIKEQEMGAKPLKNARGEIVNIPAVTQFVAGKTEFACGFFAASMLLHATKPDVVDTSTAGAIEAWAYQQYLDEYKANGANMTSGVSVADMHRLLIAALPGQAVHYYDLPITATTVQSSDLANIYAALDSGYPVACTVTEASIIDKELKANPYFWGASGNHVFVITGYDSNGDLLVHDPANVVGALQGANTPRPQPRVYDHTTIDISWASMAHMSWLVEWPNGWTPVGGSLLNQVGPAVVPPAQKQYPADVSKIIGADKNALLVDLWGAGTLLGIKPISRTSEHFQAWEQNVSDGIVRGFPLEEPWESIDDNGNASLVQRYSSGLMLIIRKKDGIVRWV